MSPQKKPTRRVVSGPVPAAMARPARRAKPAVAPTPKKLEDVIASSLEDDYKKLLNVARIPTQIKSAIKVKASEAAVTLTDQELSKRAFVAGRKFYQTVDVRTAIDDRLKTALKGVQLVSQSNDLDKIMEENAKMLYTKMKALNDAGFSADQAFQLILAEVSAKKSRS